MVRSVSPVFVLVVTPCTHCLVVSEEVVLTLSVLADALVANSVSSSMVSHIVFHQRGAATPRFPLVVLFS